MRTESVDPVTGLIFDTSILPKDILPTTKFLATVIPAFDVDNPRTLATWQGHSYIDGLSTDIYVERDRPEYLGTEGFVTRFLLSRGGRKEFWGMSEYTSSISFELQAIAVESILDGFEWQHFGSDQVKGYLRLGLKYQEIPEREPWFSKPSDFPVRRESDITDTSYSNALPWIRKLKNAILNANGGATQELDWSQNTHLRNEFRRNSPYRQT